MAESVSGRRPRVTVGLPVLDEATHLGTCLAAVAAQTYPEIVEVLVADGGSSDRTRQVAVSYPKVRGAREPDAQPSRRPQRRHCGGSR